MRSNGTLLPTGGAGLGVATGDNRTNSQGRSLGTVKARSSLVINNIVPAGGVLAVPATGTQFYVTLSTGAISIKPSGGTFNPYPVGTGLQLEEINSFDLLQVRNDTSLPVVFQLFIGFDQFIDNRLILTQTGQQLVARPTYPVANAAAAVAITDITGSQFTDINGNDWYALGREAIYISNLDPGVTLLLQESGSVVAGGPSVMAVFPVTSLRYAASGDYALSVGGGNINAIVSELYDSIPAQ